MFEIKRMLGALTLAVVSMSVSAIEWQALPTKAPEPANNPTTPAKVELGKMLYHDVRLSSNGVLSCNSCHNVMNGGDDNRAGSIGVRNQVGGRSAPTVWNSAFNSVQFWDGRAPSLEEQAKGPVTNPSEMGLKSWDEAVSRLKAMPEYTKAFAAAFGGDSSVTADNAVKAIASADVYQLCANLHIKRLEINPSVVDGKTHINILQQNLRGKAGFCQGIDALHH
jgi:cytochrome c peroxidase